MKTIIVAAFDCRYFELGSDLIRSIRAHPELDGFDIGILDLGMTREQRLLIDRAKVFVKDAVWNLDFPARKYYEEMSRDSKEWWQRPF